MNVLFITRTYPPAVGGMENLSYNLIKYFPGKKEVIVLNKKENRLSLIWYIPYALFKSCLKLPNVDVVHLGDPVLSGIGLILKILGQKPVVVNLHGLDLTYKNPLYQRYISFFLPKLDKFICISRATEKVARNLGLNPTAIIPVGVNAKKFNMRVSKENSKQIISKKFNLELRGKFILLTVGTLTKRKGVYWFLENVFTYLPHNLIYLIVGSGPDYKRIKHLIKRKGLGKKVFFLGSLSNEDLIYTYRASDIFVMPNIRVKGDMEGFGIVAIEASACGLPVVASKLEGIKDAIKQKRNGFLVEPGNSAEYIRIIKSILKSSANREKFALKASNFTIKNYDWSVIAKKYSDELYSLGLQSSK